MKLRALVLTLMASGCAGSESERVADGTWVGTITTEGNVTTVINESGSVWGGTATLVEEASIGVERGDDPYLFGRITSVTASADRIVVADTQVPAVRVYDFEGRYLHDLGRVGDGPGEYREPASVAAGNGDRVFIREDESYLVHVYQLDGAHIETWDTGHRVSGFAPMIVTEDGQLIVRVAVPSEDGLERRSGMQMFGAAGPVGPLVEPPEFDFEPVRVGAQMGSSSVVRFPPQYPNIHWVLDSSGRMIAGVATDYRFETRSADGAILVVEKYWDPVPIPEPERSDARARLTAWVRAFDPEWTWEIPPIPTAKPPFNGIVAADSGEVWVLKSMESHRIPDCAEDASAFVECWREDRAYDVFSASGRFLGTVPAPPGLVRHLAPHIDGEAFIGVIEDANGVQYVKRYRLVLPGEQTP